MLFASLINSPKPPPPFKPQEGLDPKVKSAKQAELQALEAKQQQHQQAEKEKRLATKYHKVGVWGVGV